MSLFAFRQFAKEDRGLAAIEMAFILPFMLFLFFGLVDITDLVSNNRRITSVASAVGDLVGQNRTMVTKTDINDYFKVVGLVMKPLSDSAVHVQVTGYRKTGATIAAEWTVDNGKGTACPTTISTTTMTDLMVSGNDLVVTQSCMKYKPLVTSFLGFYIIGSPLVNIEQVITLRPRASLLLDCYMDSTKASKCPKP
jgi:Flp pilus assembly protein TadG